MLLRPRRLRQNQVIRDLVQECSWDISNLIYPLFVVEGKNQKQAIHSLPDCFRYSPDCLLREIEEAYNLGLRIFALFPVINPNKKTELAEEAYNREGLIPSTLRKIKTNLPKDICLIADIALDPFTSHGHDGVLNENKTDIDNDKTLEILGRMALCLAEAGADIIAPSDMMDGRILHIRKLLEQKENLKNTLILAYSAKFASALYSPFRDALNVNLQFGDKKTYQLNPANAKEAQKEILLDIDESADMIMVKPALFYLDIVNTAQLCIKQPIIVYSVSGEYAMIKSASMNGFIDEKKVVLEMITSFRRAGASGIITYHAKEIATWLKN